MRSSKQFWSELRNRAPARDSAEGALDGIWLASTARWSRRMRGPGRRVAVGGCADPRRRESCRYSVFRSSRHLHCAMAQHAEASSPIARTLTRMRAKPLCDAAASGSRARVRADRPRMLSRTRRSCGRRREPARPTADAGSGGVGPSDRDRQRRNLGRQRDRRLLVFGCSGRGRRLFGHHDRRR